MKTKRVIKIIFVPLICIIAIILACGVKFFSKYSVSPGKYVSGDTLSMKSSQIIGLDNSIKTPTGVAYDEAAGTFWLCDYGSEDKPCSIYELSKDFRLTGKEIKLTSILDKDWNLQGITYDSQDDSFWIAVGNKIVEVDKDGKELNEIVLDQFDKFKSNGIAYDKETDSLWILCDRKLLINCSKNGKVQKSIKCNISDQDHLFFVDSSSLYISAGADYNGDDNFIMEVEVDTKKIKALYRLEDSFAVEGISVLDGKLYVINDGIFHNAKIKDNYVSCYDLN
ncbi:MAG: hypothetical protein ACLR6S_12295 [Lacrimispora saccharolytica]